MPSALRQVHNDGVTLSVRPLRPGEAAEVVDYFLGASPVELDRMGVDPSRLPASAEWTERLEAALTAPVPPGGTFYLAWLADEAPIGHAAIKDLHQGRDAAIHLHLWRAPLRGRGHGAVLFALSAIDAFDRFRLRRLICEPKASNPLPNRMLSKIGFPLARTYEGASSELSAVTTLNRYDITRAAAQEYLARVAGHGD